MAKGLRPEDRSVWEQRGGRIRVDAKGRPVFIIRKQVGGHRFEVSTRKHTLAAALVEWEKFERDPEAYKSPGDPSAGPLYLDNELARTFLAWSRDEKGNTKAWVRKQQLVLAWWMEQLAGVNLRRASLGDHIAPRLEKASDRGTKIRVLKAFFAWLVTEKHALKAEQDPTFRALKSPQAKPAQFIKSKVVPREHFLLVLEHLVAPWRDALHVQAGTGWHTSEVVRFAATGSIEPLPKTMLVVNGAVGVLVCPLHKSGDTHRTAVSAEVLEAAKRLRAHGGFSREWYDRSVRSACQAVTRPDGGVGIPVFTPGRLRHSTATWAIEAGADPKAVSAFLGHKSPVTTKRFYATHAVVPKVPTLV